MEEKIPWSIRKPCYGRNSLFRKSLEKPAGKGHGITSVNNWAAVLAAAESTAYGDLSATAFLILSRMAIKVSCKGLRSVLVVVSS